MISADARKQQQMQEQEQPGSAPVTNATKATAAPVDNDQRKALKFGFSAKSGTSKVSEIMNFDDDIKAMCISWKRLLFELRNFLHTVVLLHF